MYNINTLNISSKLIFILNKAVLLDTLVHQVLLYTLVLQGHRGTSGSASFSATKSSQRIWLMPLFASLLATCGNM